MVLNGVIEKSDLVFQIRNRENAFMHFYTTAPVIEIDGIDICDGKSTV